MAKHRMYFLCALKRDVEATRQVIITFDRIFTLARDYPMNALHDIECIYNQYLVSMTNSPKAEEGIDSVRPLEQLVGCTNKYSLMSAR